MSRYRALQPAPVGMVMQPATLYHASARETYWALEGHTTRFGPSPLLALPVLTGPEAAPVTAHVFPDGQPAVALIPGNNLDHAVLIPITKGTR